MNLDNLRIGLRGLKANRLRTSLTMLGILIGVAAVILMVAVGNGISVLVQHQIETLGSNALYVLPERNRGPTGRAATLSRPNQLTKQDVKALSDPSRTPHVVAIAPTVGTQVTAAYQGATYAFSNFVGSQPIFGVIRNATLREGRFFTEQDMIEHAKVAVIGQTVEKNLFPKGVSPLGARVQFNGAHFRIIGVTEKKGSNGFQDQDDVAIAPLTAVEDALTGVTTSYTAIAVQASSRQDTKLAQAEVVATLRATHRLPPTAPLDFLIFNQAQLLNAGKTAAVLFAILLGVVAAVSLLVGGIGVMNIMLVTVTERTREIGIRKAVGAQRSDILGQFLVESVIVSMLGGLLGVALALAASRGHFGSLKPVIQPFSIPLGFFVSGMVGVFFGAWPANRAASLTPIEALRHE